MMERWFTASELAALALPGMPGKHLTTMTAYINRRKCSAFVRYRRTRGNKAAEIHFSGLPAEAQAELLRRKAAGRPRSLPPLIRQRAA